MIALQKLIPTGKTRASDEEAIDREAIDRSPMSQAKTKAIGDDDAVWNIVHKSQSMAQSLEQAEDNTLREHTDRLRAHALRARNAIDDDLLCLAAAGITAATKRILGFQLFDVQLFAGVATTRGAVAEMQTGEGKTLAGILPAYVHALANRGVHVATTNRYLATRDYETLKPIFRLLGMTVGLVTEDSRDEEARQAYDADVTFGPGHVFGFDFLKDQLTLRRSNGSELGSNVYRKVNHITDQSRCLQRPTRGRGLYCAIVDEIDNVLVDDAVSPLLLSESSDEEAPDAELHRRANTFAKSMSEDQFNIDQGRSEVMFSESAYGEIYGQRDMAAHAQLVRPWHEYIALSLRAIHCLRRDIDYVVRHEKIHIVDASTGRVFVDRTWSSGLHQAVLANHQLPITPESKTLTRITRQRFFRHYQILAGMTGTALGCEKEFASVYGMPVVKVPLRLPSKRILRPDLLCSNEVEKWDAIVDEAKTVSQDARAVLIGTHSIQQSLAIAERLEDAGLEFQLLNGVQDADEASIIAKAGQPGAITVATNLAGRGTDIKLDPIVAQGGGLHVILAQRHALTRVDRQLIGRCARCGDPGSARAFVSGDEPLLRQHAPWIERAISRHRNRGRDDVPTHPFIARDVEKMQRDLERRAAHSRWRMLQADRETESLLRGTHKQNDTPSGCYRLS